MAHICTYSHIDSQTDNMEDLKYMTDYHTLFDTQSYLDSLSNPWWPYVEIRLNWQNRFWSTFHTSSKEGVTVLEFGGGPNVANVISAAANVKHIVFSEYTETNRNAVNSWIKGEPGAHDWSPAIEYVVKRLEGNTTDKAASVRAAEMRKKIISVVPCDITMRPVIQLKPDDIGKRFDVVSTTSCLEVCTNSEKDYNAAIAGLSELLKPGGTLYMSGALDDNLCVIGKYKFRVFNLSQKIIEEAMANAGFVDIEFRKEAAHGDSDVVFAVNGRKS